MAQSCKAVYESSSETHTFDPASSANSDSQSHSTALKNVRSQCKDLQQQINKFLTAKMEDDKKIEGSNGVTNGLKHAKEDEEEENYGEDQAEED